MPATASINIVQAIADQHLLRPFLAASCGDLSTWRPWKSALECLYGLPVSDPALVYQCTGRQAALMPEDGFDEALFLTGRRSGKSRIAACIATFEAVMSGREQRLAPGERGMVAVIAPTRYQAGILRNYLRGVLSSADMLQNEVASDTRDELLLNNGVCMAVLTADWRTVRGFTLLACVVDEAAFLGLDVDSRVRSDWELIRAIRPSLATCGGRLIAISSPYARKGYCYDAHDRHYGNDSGRILCWKAPSRVMNPTLPQRVVDDALAEDLAGARAEYMAEFRDDVIAFVSPEMVAALVTPGRTELLPRVGIRYRAFCDLSGGRGDAAALAIGHAEDDRGRKLVMDVIRRWPSPHVPQSVVTEISDILREYGCRSVVGDLFSGDWSLEAFRQAGITYHVADENKSALYAKLLPRITDQSIELLDNPVLIRELCNLERRTRSGGRDLIDHPAGREHHDDMANVCAGMAAICGRPHVRLGTF